MPNISKNALKQIIVEQQNIAADDKIVERAVLPRINSYLNLPQAVIIAGIRRCGKSVLLRQVMSGLAGRYYYFNFEDERLINFRAENLNDLYEALAELYGRRKIFFFDEIQNISGWERFVRRMQDHGNKFFITGSNASLLSGELGTRLTGRYLDCALYPFSFSEFLRWKNFIYAPEDLLDTVRRAEIKKYFNEYFLSGGMPEYIRFGSDEALKKVYESIIFRDIISRYELKEERALRELSVYLFSNLSVPFSFSALKEMLRLGSMNTVKSYIQYLENGFLFFTVNQYNFSYRKQILSPKKIYCVDNGMARVLGFSFSENKGRLLENMIFLELKRRALEIYYFSDKDGREADFVARKDNRITDVVQVCWSMDDEKTRAREIAGLDAALAALNEKQGFILTDNEEEQIKIGRKVINIMPAFKWLLGGVDTVDREAGFLRE